VSSLSQYPSTQQQHQHQGHGQGSAPYQAQAQEGYGYAQLAPAAAAAHGQGSGYGGYGGQQEQLRDDGYRGGAPVDRPPSYGTVPGASGYRVQPEKSQYQAR
jgi:hypothetical protein